MLTATELQSAKPRANIYRLKDSPNLYLVVYPSGRKSWEYRYQDAGKARAVVLGEYGDRQPALGGKAARIRRDEVAADRQKGRDPATARKLERALQDEALAVAKADKAQRVAAAAVKRAESEHSAITFRNVAEKWLSTNRSHWSKGHSHQNQQSLEDHVFPVLGDKHPDSIQASHILDLLNGMLADGRVETARRVRQRMDAIFEHAGLYYGVQKNPVAMAKRELGKRFKAANAAHPEKNFPCVATKDVPQLLRAMRAYVGTPVTRSLLWFVALTGCRTGEARGATWDEFDLTEAVWDIPATRMKGRRPHRVYLAPAVLDLLKELKPHTRRLPWVFPHPTRKDKPASENAILFTLAAIGFKDKHSGHGFRRMFSTIANESGKHRPDVIETALAHAEGNAVRAAYNAAQYERERRALAKWYAAELQRLEARR